jgi:hypothetical protein
MYFVFTVGTDNIVRILTNLLYFKYHKYAYLSFRCSINSKGAWTLFTNPDINAWSTAYIEICFKQEWHKARQTLFLSCRAKELVYAVTDKAPGQKMRAQIWSLKDWGCDNVLPDKGYRMPQGAVTDEFGAIVELWSEGGNRKKSWRNTEPVSLLPLWILREIMFRREEVLIVCLLCLIFICWGHRALFIQGWSLGFFFLI